MADSEKVCPHLHIPLQSGDNRILESMRRKHTANEFADIIEYAAKKIPDVGLGTDVMVGYPTEDEDAFRNTKKLLADLPVSYYHVFTYSDREGTSAWKIQPKVDYHEKKKRMKIMIEMGNRKKFAFANQFIGSTVEVLLEENKNGKWSGLTGNYMRIQIDDEDSLYNHLRRVKIVDVQDDRIRGELI